MSEHSKLRERAEREHGERIRRHADGGTADARQDRIAVAKGVHKHERHLHPSSPLTKLKDGGAAEGHHGRRRLDRPGRKRRDDGGSANTGQNAPAYGSGAGNALQNAVDADILKSAGNAQKKRGGRAERARGGHAGKVPAHVNVIVAGGQGQDRPVPVPTPAPAAGMPPPRPPMPPPGAGMPPPGMGGPPGGMPPGMGGPPGMPGMRARGGRAKRAWGGALPGQPGMQPGMGGPPPGMGGGMPPGTPPPGMGGQPGMTPQGMQQQGMQQQGAQQQAAMRQQAMRQQAMQQQAMQQQAMQQQGGQMRARGGRAEADEAHGKEIDSGARKLTAGARSGEGRLEKMKLHVEDANAGID